MGLLDDLEAAERAASLYGKWSPNGLCDAMVADGYSPADASFADLACRLAPALLRVARAAQRAGAVLDAVGTTGHAAEAGYDLRAALAALLDAEPGK